MLTVEDEEYLILGTSTGFIFVLSANDFKIKYSKKVSDEEIMDI